MLSQVYYLLRSRQDGNYLVAHPHKSSRGSGEPGSDPSYLLMFREHFDALSYLNKYGPDVRDRFAVESIPGPQVAALLKRWGFAGVGVVEDPLLPRIEFLSQA